jgi:hypothetical protein
MQSGTGLESALQLDQDIVTEVARLKQLSAKSSLMPLMSGRYNVVGGGNRNAQIAYSTHVVAEER